MTLSASMEVMAAVDEEQVKSVGMRMTVYFRAGSVIDRCQCNKRQCRNIPMSIHLS